MTLLAGASPRRTARLDAQNVVQLTRAGSLVLVGEIVVVLMRCKNNTGYANKQIPAGFIQEAIHLVQGLLFEFSFASKF